MKIIKDAIMRETDGAKEKLSFTRTEQAKVLNEIADIKEELLAILTKQQRTLEDLVSEKSKLLLKEGECKVLRDKIRDKEKECEKLRYQTRESSSIRNNDLEEENRKLREELNELRFNNQRGREIDKDKEETKKKPRTRYASIVTLQNEIRMDGTDPH